MRHEFNLPPLPSDSPALASPDAPWELYQLEAPCMDYCRPAPPAPAPPAQAMPAPAQHQRTWTEDYATAHHARLQNFA